MQSMWSALFDTEQRNVEKMVCQGLGYGNQHMISRHVVGMWKSYCLPAQALYPEVDFS